VTRTLGLVTFNSEDRKNYFQKYCLAFIHSWNVFKC
jgi:hypothetical protein